ncbi:hypothetical protein CAPTEDRAFT_220901 [Capitella teleta]|uniref:Nucleoplasmin core domain-containing protein n=1 Tax=Capitella teleta TaxID=283909 RepID=R7TU00_CAPTE|nr:hypothetical protein CAPTEDRAFT_220901 [Capitella teleta]|eukprot:ELT97087.1 hypothetical protein CAPTEDRAFT_220901 [Capitella teleta]
MKDLSTPPPPITRAGKVRNTSQTFMSETLSAKLADGNEREFFWGCTLSKDEPEYTWTCLDEDNDMDFLQHTLFLKHATLGAAAVEKERNLVAIETKTFDGEDVKIPLVSLTCGATESTQLDLVLQHEVPFTLRLVMGTGPVHFSGNQLVEIPVEDNYGTETETEFTENEETEEEELDEEEELEEEEEEKPAKKRKASSKGNKKKRGKISVSDDVEEESLDESMEAETTEYSEEETEESSEEEEEEESSSPVQPCEIVIRTVKPKKKVCRKPKSHAVVTKAIAKRVRKVVALKLAEYIASIDILRNHDFKMESTS